MKKMERILKYTYILIILITIGILLFFYNQNQGYWWDEAVYLGLAQNLQEGNYWINVPGQEAFRPPLFPVIISGLLTFGFGIFLIKFLPILFAIFSVLVIYDIVRVMYNKEIALWSALVLTASHYFLFFSLKLLTESLFILLSLLMIYLYYSGIKEDRRLFLLAGLFTGLAFLTRYMGGILFLVYLIYPLLIGKKKEIKRIYKNKFYWSGFIISILVLIPWFINGLSNFGSPVGSIFVGFGTVAEGFYIGPWYFHFANWIEFFGLIGLFAIPGIYVLFSERTKENKLLLLFILLSLLALILIPRKEVRYLLHYFHIYAIMIAIGIVALRKKQFMKWVIPVIAIVLVIMNIFSGIQLIQSDLRGGVSLKESGFWVAERIGYGETIMSENIPVLYYTSGTRIIQFPVDETDLMNSIQENRVSYIILDSREPTYPNYVWTDEGNPSEVFDQFILEKTYSDYEYEKARIDVWVYKV